MCEWHDEFKTMIDKKKAAYHVRGEHSVWDTRRTQKTELGLARRNARWSWKNTCISHAKAEGRMCENVWACICFWNTADFAAAMAHGKIPLARFEQWSNGLTSLILQYEIRKFGAMENQWNYSTLISSQLFHSFFSPNKIQRLRCSMHVCTVWITNRRWTLYTTL